MEPPKGPFDPADTDWGRAVEARHQDNLQRFSHIDAKLDVIDRDFNKKWEILDRHVSEDTDMHRELSVALGKLDVRVGRNEKTIDALEDDLRDIKINTETLVNFSKAASVFRKFLIWALPLAVSALTAYITWTLKK
jgi:hypothetical protein